MNALKLMIISFSILNQPLMAKAADSVNIVGECIVVQPMGDASLHFKKLKTIRGASERDCGEAFDEAQQLCANAAAQVGVSGNLFLVKDQLSLSQSHGHAVSESKSTTTGVHGEKSSARGLLRRESREMHSRDTSEFSAFSSAIFNQYGIKFTPVTLDDCRPIKVNQKGTPRYIGTERPRG